MAKKNAPIPLNGNVYCDWNAFTFCAPMPERLSAGDLVVWSWSGDSKKPGSKMQSGLFRVSVFDGKRRRLLKVKHTRVHALLRFRDDREREQKLAPLVRELRALKGRTAICATRGYEIALADTPASEETTPVKATTSAAPGITPLAAAPAKPVQGTLF